MLGVSLTGLGLCRPCLRSNAGLQSLMRRVCAATLADEGCSLNCRHLPGASTM